MRKARLCAHLMRGNFLKYILAILAVAISSAAGFATPLVLAGAGATLLPEPLARTAAAQGAATARIEPPIRRSVVLMSREGATSAAGEAFRSLALRQPGSTKGPEPGA